MIRNGITFGSWDLLHPGHCIFLSECSQQCDRLFVGLHVDPSVERSNKNKPVQTVYERYLQLAYLKSVYHVLPYGTEEDVENILGTLDLQVRFLGSDYRDVLHTGAAVCTRRNIDVIYIDRHHKWSSTELRNRIQNEWMGRERDFKELDGWNGANEEESSSSPGPGFTTTLPDYPVSSKGIGSEADSYIPFA